MQPAIVSHIVSHETRPDQAPGVRRLVASIARHAPGWSLRLCLPAMPPDLGPRVPPPSGVAGWDVKPHLLAQALRAGADRAVWLDADVMLAGDPAPLLATDALVMSFERPWGGTRDRGARAAAWGMTPRRRFPASVNSAVLGVSRAHLPLLDAWAEALRHPGYRRAQAAPWPERPAVFHGDQDALTALLSGPFCGIAIRPLQRGSEIVHAIAPRGVTTAERLRGLRRPPVFVHGQGAKPWTADRGRHPRTAERHLDLSPYTILGGWPAVTRTGRILRRIAGGHPLAAGLPLAMWEDLRAFPRARLWRRGFARDAKDEL